MEVSCFVPAYNEAEGIGRCVRVLDGILAAACRSHEIVVVDDASTDGTADAVRALELARCRVVSFDDGPSFRENLGRAMQSARARYVFFVDADLASDSNAIPALLDRLRAGADIVTASRYVAGARAQRSPRRWLFSVVYNRWVRLMFASPFRDHQCGLKFFRREVLKELLGAMYDGERSSRAWFWDVELLLRAHWAGRRIEEVPVAWRERKDSRFMATRQAGIPAYALRFLRERVAEIARATFL